MTATATRISPASVQDADAISALLTELEHPTAAEAVAERLPGLLAAGDEVLLAWSGDRALGLVALHVMSVLHRSGPLGRITSLVVSSEARGQGIGRALVEAAEARFRARGCVYAEVTSHGRRTEAHAVYEHLGYAKTHVRLWKTLDYHLTVSRETVA